MPRRSTLRHSHLSLRLVLRLLHEERGFKSMPLMQTTLQHGANTLFNSPYLLYLPPYLPHNASHPLPATRMRGTRTRAACTVLPHPPSSVPHTTGRHFTMGAPFRDAATHRLTGGAGSA